MPSSAAKPPTRRDLLLAGTGLAALAGACHSQPPTPPGTRVPFAALPLGERVTVEHEGGPVEVVRTSTNVTARSLLCSHTGCNVRWDAASSNYLCLCHEGRFNAQGQAIAGFPTRPLREVRTLLLPDAVILLNDSAPTASWRGGWPSRQREAPG